MNLENIIFTKADKTNTIFVISIWKTNILKLLKNFKINKKHQTPKFRIDVKKVNKNSVSLIKDKYKYKLSYQIA